MKRSLILLTLLLFCLVPARAEDAVVAWVNDRPIRERELAAKMKPVLDRLALQPGSEKHGQLLPKVREKALQLLVDRAAVLTSEEAKRVKVSEDELRKRVEEFLAGEGLGREGFELRLREEGRSLDDWRGELRDGMVIERLKKELAEGCAASTKDEVSDLYHKSPERFKSKRRVKVSTILVDPEHIQQSNIRRVVTGICNRVMEAGEEQWDLAAAEFSSGPRAEDGGHWDWMEPAKLPGTLGAEALRMELEEIVKVAHGHCYYILRLDAVEEPVHLSFEDAKERVQAELMNRKAAAAWKSWLVAERSEARIKRVRGGAGVR